MGFRHQNTALAITQSLHVHMMAHRHIQNLPVLAPKRADACACEHNHISRPAQNTHATWSALLVVSIIASRLPHLRV
jgi:ABC-type nickel/cobalt efflux system permease component RcnA